MARSKDREATAQTMRQRLARYSIAESVARFVVLSQEKTKHTSVITSIEEERDLLQGQLLAWLEDAHGGELHLREQMGKIYVDEGGPYYGVRPGQPDDIKWQEWQSEGRRRGFLTVSPVKRWVAWKPWSKNIREKVEAMDND